MKKRGLSINHRLKVPILVIEQVYENKPEGYHVDHVIPLVNENVTGLHVHWNLQYLTSEENVRKGNSFDGTMENESWRDTLK